LKEKIEFLRQYNIFQSLSEVNLSLLSYSMTEETFYRGQVVYQEGVDTIEKIYLIKDGEFELSKQLIRPVKKVQDGEVKSLNDEESYFSYTKMQS
jgi:CRP-like cAMP-binding protein